MRNTLLERVSAFADTHAGEDGVARTPIPGLFCIRADEVTELDHALSRPIVCLVLQGSKHVVMGHKSFDFSAGDSLLITADVPTASRITRASRREPYYSLVFELDAAILAELAVDMKALPAIQSGPVEVAPTDIEVEEAALRLMRLLDRPGALPVLQSQLVRELHYWLLEGQHGGAIRRLGWPDGYVQRVARAVSVLRADYARPLPVEKLAAVAGMSLSSFHHHFRAVTSLSPLQFQKQLRLIEARRLMLMEGMTAASAAFAVGYESVPQFTREYGRMYGAPPAADAERTRRAAGLAS